MVDYIDRWTIITDRTRAATSTHGASACMEASDYGVQASPNCIRAPDRSVETEENGIRAASSNIEATTICPLSPLAFSSELRWLMKAIPGWRVVLWAPRNTVKLVPVAGKRPAHPGKMVVSNSPSSVSPSLVRDIDYA